MNDPCAAPHTATAEELAERLAVDARRGLDAEEVAARLSREGPNRLPEPPRPSELLRLARQFSSPIVLTLVAAAVVASVVGIRAASGSVLERFGDAIAILLIVLLNAVLGFVQERKADEAIAALRSMQAPSARVVRGGAVHTVAAEGLVPGDVVELDAGDAVPADCRLVEAASLRVDESSLTGESVPVDKDAGHITLADAVLAERPTMLYSGTVVVGGSARALVVATGTKTELGRIGRLVGAVETEATPLERHLGVFGRKILWACLAVTLLLLAWGLARGGRTFTSILLEAVSFAVAIIPEGLPAVTTMTLAIGVQRMARRGAVVRKLAAVETLGSATVICTDKTGTLTRNQMTVREVIAGGTSWSVSGSGYDLDGEIAGVEGTPRGVLARLLGTATLCNDAHVDRSSGRTRIIGDPTEGALLVLAEKAHLDVDTLRAEHPVLTHAPFDAVRRRMSVTAAARGGAVVHAKGALDVILPLCTSVARDDSNSVLDDATRASIAKDADALAARGLRVLAFAARSSQSGTDDEAGEGGLTFLGVVGMMDPPREGVTEAVAACARAGVRTVMITGHHAVTATAIARAIGIAGPEHDTITGAELLKLDDEELGARIERVRVFARVAPEQKLRIVRALAGRGHVVAMTGDGVNDAPALREAHIGVAMGRGGTEVARQASDIVLTDDDFTTLVDAVREGRAIYRNIQKFVFFLLSSNAGLALTVFAVALTGFWPPLSATMILWMNLVTNGLPALALGVDPPSTDQMREPPRRAGEPLLGRRDLLGLALVGFVVGGSALVAYSEALCPAGGSAERHRTVAFFVLSIGPLLHAWSCRSPTESIFRMRPRVSKALLGATLVSIAVQALVLVPALRPVFHAESLDVHHVVLVVACSIVILVVVEMAKAIDRRRPHRAQNGDVRAAFARP
jgi:Ca2+-transporting ATPase